MSWLARLLGYEEVLNAKTRDIISLEAQVQGLFDQQDMLHEMLRDKDIEIRRLTDLILTEHGVIRPEPVQRESTEKSQPINRRENFRTIRNRFEAADRKLAEKITKDHAEVLTDYYKKKNAVAEQEGMG